MQKYIPWLGGLFIVVLLGFDDAKRAGGGPTTDIQAFTAGAGTYTWTKPANCTVVWALVQGAGHPGASGGYSTSDSGGGGGGGGAHAWQTFACSSLGATETVTLAAGGVGGLAKATDGNGNSGTDAGPTSFGALLKIDPSTNSLAVGGTSTAGTGDGGQSITNHTSVIGLYSLTAIGSGGNGDDAGAGTAGSAVSASLSNDYGLFVYVPPTPGGGGGGTNGGANHTNGGAGGVQRGANSITYRAALAGGSGNGAAGTSGSSSSGYAPASDIGALQFAGGRGGGGGAGGVDGTQDGGPGGAGENCGGGGGGGGSSESGATGSGAGGSGGAGCVYVVAW